MWRHGLLLTLCLALGALAALFSPGWLQTTPSSWSYTDLRFLDAADALQPTHDLVAVYTRSTPESLQIRLDMLEHAATPDYDLYLVLDSGAGGSRSLPVATQADLEWDLLLVIPASGEMQVLDSRLRPVPAAGLRVVRDPVLDQVIISVKMQPPIISGNQPPSTSLSRLEVKKVTSTMKKQPVAAMQSGSG